MAEAAIEETGDAPDGDVTEDQVTDGLPPKDDSPAADAPAGTVLDADVSDDDAPAAATTWPEDWRDKLSGEDEATQNMLKRFTSPEALGKAYATLRKSLSSGQLTKALPDGASDEEVAAWREQNGIPETADKYELDLDGRVLPEGDDEIVSGFLEAAHEHNFPPEHVNTAIRWYADLVENQTAAQIDADKAYQTEAIDELRTEWGVEYRGNVNAVKTFLGDLDGAILSARGPDGQILGNNPVVLKQFAQWAREMNPASTITGIGTPDLKGLTEEIDKITSEMGKGEAGEYYGGDKDANGETKMMVRYRELLEAQERMKQ